MTAPVCVVFRVGDGWSALYVDGKLDQIGDSYLVDERIAEIYGVAERESPFMQRIQRRDQAPATLAEVDHEDAILSALQEEAESLRRQASDLMRRADEIAGSTP